LERAATKRELDWKAMALTPNHRSPAWRREVLFDAVFALIFAVVLVTLANVLWQLL
jgi:hypothetical protein